jgi:hypothetical protein
MRLDGANARLVLVPDGDLLGADRIGVSPALARTAATAVFEAHPGEALGGSAPVRLVGLEDIPDGVVVIGEALAHRLELRETSRASWALRTDGFLRQPAEELEIELTVDRPLEELVDELNRSGALLGRLLLARAGGSSGDLWVEAGGENFRVRQLRPAPMGGEILYETGPQTRFSLFAPALRSSVDVVILADCSGSMSWDDIEDRADATPVAPKRSFWGNLLGGDAVRQLSTIKRITALKQALDNLLAVRLGTPGRVSRVALVAFTERCQTRFPRGGGMVEMDENAAPELVQQFRDAIGLLQPEDAGTNIGNALNHAAELLDQHGRPGNDRLIVLISDGADWKPKGGDDAGEMVRSVDEPVSLMEDLHQRMRISLHALGISNESIFWSWWKRTRGSQAPHPSAVPNHKLLEALVVVGGGDPTRTGDASVVADYFSGLGRGVSRRLNVQARSPERPRLSDGERSWLRERLAAGTRSRAAAESQARRNQVCEELHDLFRAANEYARSLAGRDLFRVSTDSIDVLHRLMFEPVRHKREFDWWWGKLHQQFFECRDVRLCPEDPAVKPSYPIPAVLELLGRGYPETAPLNHLRNWCSHSWLAPGDEKQRRDFDRSLQRLHKILQSLIGRAALEDDDEEGWIALQMALLHRLRDLLSAAVQAFRSAGGRPVQPRPAAAHGGIVFVG